MLPSDQKFQQITSSRQAQFPRSNLTESPLVPGGWGRGGGVLPVMVYGEAPAERGTCFRP